MFSWINFDTEFIKDVLNNTKLNNTKKKLMSLAEMEDDKDGLVAVLNSEYGVPNLNFIENYRTIIEKHISKYYTDEFLKICKALNITAKTTEEKIRILSSKPFSTSLANAYSDALYDISGIETNLNQFSKFKHDISINMAETYTEDIPLYDFQKKAVSKLKKFYITDDNDTGMMVMPTGSGKSRTATYFLIKEMIAEGYQILWIAHRHMLIDQAAECFYNFAGLSKINKPDIKNYRINCISGEHMSMKQAEKAEIIVASIQSVFRGKDHLKSILKRGKLMIVIDECHHAIAPTYQNTIKLIKKNKSKVKLLGLTATPVRANDKDTARLMNLFDDNVIYDISMSDLIAKRILADPKYLRIETQQDFEPEISYDEGKYINKYKELPETLVNKIAKSKQRNQLIIDNYINNAELYGKTLIFALNVVHCRLLYDELNKLGVKCGLVYSGKEDNTKVINDFRDGKINVLVNVNILTEGTDVPDIQTVLLTRPTGSEGLLMQMIGRGMRGPSAKGTETVNIVDFHDKWSVFNKWLNPQWIIMDELEEDEPEIIEYKKRIYEEYEWKQCLDLYYAIRAKVHEYNCVMTIPVGWYTLIDDNGDITRMLVFEDQLKGFVSMMANKKYWKSDGTFTSHKAIEQYFSGFCSPPLEYEMNLLIDNIKNLEEEPTIHSIKDRKYAIPQYAIEKAESENSDIFIVGSALFDEHEIIRDFYPTKEEYLMELSRVKIYGRESVLGTKVEELPIEKIEFDTTPAYDINELYQEVIEEMWNGDYQGVTGISWTDKYYKTYFGIFYPENKTIKINSVLNSKDVDREIVKFVIYHETLHRDNKKHDKAFRELEHKYPDYEEKEHFLYSEMRKYDINWL